MMGLSTALHPPRFRLWDSRQSKSSPMTKSPLMISSAVAVSSTSVVNVSSTSFADALFVTSINVVSPETSFVVDRLVEGQMLRD